MKRKCKISPDQLSIFNQIVYADKSYASLKKAMLCALQDFYIRKKLPSEIITSEKVYKLKDMKRFWNLHELHDVYVC